MANTLENEFMCQFHEKLYLNPEISDVNFIFNNGEQKLTSHKVILAAGSPVFQQMFFGSLKKNGDVSITDVSIDSFKEFLQFFYLQKVTLTMEKIEEVAYLADKYDMLDFVTSCASFLKEKLTIDKMCWGYQLAIVLKISDLMAFCEEQISIHIKTVFDSESFQRCGEITLKHILAMETLLCYETDIFKACLMWAKFACKKNGTDQNNGENLRIQLGECFDLIRFGTMSIEEFSSHATLCKDLFQLDEIKEILFTTTNKEPSKFIQKPRSGPLIIWDNAKILTCKRFSLTSSYSMFHIHADESVWFSTNIVAVLGEIVFSSLNSRDGYGISFEMSIFEINRKNFDVPKKRLLEQNVSLTKNVSNVSLTQKLLINPQKMYEIRLESSEINGCYHNCQWHSNVEVDNLKVKFHKNPKFVDKERHGLVHSLLFNHFIWPKKNEQLNNDPGHCIQLIEQNNIL